MGSIFIIDGYTLVGKVEARPGLHDEVHFSYRPALPARVNAWLKADKSTGERELKADVSLLIEHLTTWDVTGPDDKEVPITAANLERCMHPVLQVMVNHVTGYSATDWSEREKNSSKG